jgi:hypothetical protein
MEQFSMTPHKQSFRAWLEHPLLILFVPYSLRTVSFARDTAPIRMLFESHRQPWRQVDLQGLFNTVQRRYETVWSGEQPRIHGPYGHKAWTMATLVNTALDEHGALLTLRTFPHRSVVLGMLAQLAFISVCALIVGVPGAPWFPLIFFGLFLYIATVIATKVEAARIVTLVRQAVEEHSPPTA